MKKIFAAIFVLPLLSSLAFAQNAAPDAAAGKAYWQGNNSECRSCHGDMGQGGFGPILAGQGLTPVQIESAVRHPAGIMPTFTETQISPAVVANLAAWFASLPKPATQGPWRYTATASMSKGQKTFHDVGCAQCHEPIFYRARAIMGGMDADFDLFKRMVYAHTTTTPQVDAALRADPSAPTPPTTGPSRAARMRMGNFNPQVLSEAQLKDIYDWTRNEIGFRPLIEGHLSAPAATPAGESYTLSVDNGGLKDKGWPAEGVVVDLAIPAGTSVVSATGEGYKGVHKATQFNLVDVYGETRVTKNNIDVAEWLVPRIAAKDKKDFTITLSKPAPAGDKLQGTVRWAKPAPKDGDTSKETLDILLPRVAGAPAAAD